MQKATSSSRNKLVIYLLILGISIISVQFILHACTFENIFTKWIPYAGLFVAGYVWGKKKLKQRSLLCIYAVSLAATIGFNYLNYFLLAHHNSIFSPPGCLSHYFDHYASINVVIMSLSAFLLLLHLPYKRIKQSSFLSKVVHSVAKASFGIYILHLFVGRFLEVRFRFGIDFTPLPIAVYSLIKLLLVFMLSYILTIVLKRLPVIKRVFGENK